MEKMASQTIFASGEADSFNFKQKLGRYDSKICFQKIKAQAKSLVCINDLQWHAA